MTNQMDFIEFCKQKKVSKILRISFFRKLAVSIYKRTNSGKSIALIPLDVLKKHDIKEVQKLVKENKSKDFFYIENIRIDIIHKTNNKS